MRSLGVPGKAILGVLLTGLLLPATALSQQIHRNAFESVKPAWVKGGFDAPFDEILHATTTQVWHDGQRSEYISLQAKPGPGSFIYYQYPTGRAPLGGKHHVGSAQSGIRRQPAPRRIPAWPVFLRMAACRSRKRENRL